MLRGALLFVAGALVGANVVYFVMSRHASAAATAPLASVMDVVREPVPVEPLAAADMPDAALKPGLDRATPESPDIGPATADPGPDNPDSPTPDSPRPPGDAATGSRHDNGDNVAAVDALELIVPVRDVRRDQLTNTYEDARGSGRVHEAIDIMAARGTPVLAAADGKVEKLFTSDRGGLTIYQFEPSGRYAYYYAHLDRYAEGLDEGAAVKQGEVIGYVGSTGNASDDAPHLHFGIFRLAPERQWWKGTAINPYPVLQAR